MNYRFVIVSLSLLLPTIYSTAQDRQTDLLIQQGNQLYKQRQYDKAEAIYRQVLEKDRTNTTARFNLSNALYLQAKPAEAITELEELVMNTNEPELKAKAYYNKGAILSAQKKLEESIEAYKNSLRNDPSDKETRENLQKALTELKKKTPPPPKKENKKQQQKQQQQMDQKEAEQRLKLLEQKEKEVQQRLQQAKTKTGGNPKDW